MPAYAYARATVFRTSMRRANTFPIQNGYRETRMLPQTYDCDAALTTSTNIALFSNDITTGGTWTAQGFTATQGDATCNPDPFGGNAAWRVAGSVADSYDFQAFTGLTIGQPYTWSLYTKKASDNAGSPVVSIYFQTPSNAPASMLLTSSWQRTLLNVTAAATTGSAFIGGGSSFTAADGPICVYGGQVEPGSSASPYIATKGVPAAVSALTLAGASVVWQRPSSATCTKNNKTLVSLGANQPRCNADGCLVESGATSLITRSEAFEASSWNSVSENTVVTANTTVAPDGNTTADTVTDTASNLKHRIYNFGSGSGITVTNATTYAFSVFAKPGTLSWIRLSNGSDTRQVTFNISTCAVGTVATGGAVGTVVASANGFCRVAMAYATTATAEFPVIYIGDTESHTFTTTYVGGTGTVFLWGAQLELGSIASSYVFTGATAVARGPDYAPVNTPASFLNDREGCAAASVTPSASVVTTNAYVLGSNSTTAPLFLASSTLAGVFDGTSAANATITSAIGRSVPLRSFWYGSVIGVAEGNATPTTVAYDGTIIGSLLLIGTNSAGAQQVPGYVGNVRFGNSRQGCR